MNIEELLTEVEHLPAADKWRLVHHVLQSLERGQAESTGRRQFASQAEWQQFLSETYGSTRDTPIERADQGEYEIREPLEPAE